jgi:hypothetical protein
MEKLFTELHVNWNHPGSCNALMCERYKFFGGKKKGMVLGRCAVVTVFLGGWDFGWRGSKEYFWKLGVRM